MIRFLIFLTFAPSLLIADPKIPHLLTRLAFGSCSNQEVDQPIWNTIAALSPDLFIHTGDIVYADTNDMQIMKEKYELLSRKAEFANFRNKIPFLAIWDDHDFGLNNAGNEYSQKEGSKSNFLKFLKEPHNSERWSHPGIYHSYLIGPVGKRVHLILLDGRTFRDKPCIEPATGACPIDFNPLPNSDRTMLGIEQWRWLEESLRRPAELKIIVSGTQFAANYSDAESWNQMPHEKKRMLALIKNTKAAGVIFISGNLHYGEISLLKDSTLYPIYDITSSGLTHAATHVKDNPLRIKNAVYEINFGLIDINWHYKEMLISIKNRNGITKNSLTIKIDNLK